MNAIDLHTSAAAYALNALPGDETASFQQHLADCAVCRQEVDDYTATATMLAHSAAEHPPAALKERLLAAVRTTRQLPPLVSVEDRRRSTQRLPQLLAAAALVVAAAVGGVVVGLQLGDDTNGVSEVVAADDARTSSDPLRGGGSMTMIRSADLGAAVVVTENLPQLTDEQVYQLWVIDTAGAAHATDVLIDADSPNAHLVQLADPDYAVAITREPAGGSQTPSMQPLGVVGTA